MEYNPLLPEVIENPYPYYRELRKTHPVYPLAEGAAFAVSRYEDVTFILRHHELFSSEALANLGEGRMLIATDPPTHTRLRYSINQGFTPAKIEALEPRIQEVTSQLIGAALPAGEFDLISDLAVPLPITIIAEMLGVDPACRDDFKRWSASMVGGQPSADSINEATRERVMETWTEFSAYFQKEIAERRREPRDDLISELVRAEGEEQALSSEEVLAFAQLLLIAGTETTTHLLGNIVLALLEHPDQLQKVREEPSLVPNLVEEVLRYDPPVQLLYRLARRDTEIAGHPIPKGSLVVPLYGSANRDERKFPEPDRFDVTRNTQGHVGFGYGIHYCLGAPVARLEAIAAIEQLLRLPRLAKSAAIERSRSSFLRGLKRLPLTFTPRSTAAG